MAALPPGFEKFETSSPFNQLAGPYFYKKDANKLIFGLLVEEKHCNTAGKLHGGMVGAIADIALGHNIGNALVDQRQTVDNDQSKPEVPFTSMATVSLSTDFVGSAGKGDWVEVHVDVQRAGKSLAFANAYVIRDAEQIARVSGVFRIFRSGS